MEFCKFCHTSPAPGERVCQTAAETLHGVGCVWMDIAKREDREREAAIDGMRTRLADATSRIEEGNDAMAKLIKAEADIVRLKGLLERALKQGEETQSFTYDLMQAIDRELS